MSLKVSTRKNGKGLVFHWPVMGHVPTVNEAGEDLFLVWFSVPDGYDAEFIFAIDTDEAKEKATAFAATFPIPGRRVLCFAPFEPDRHTKPTAKKVLDNSDCSRMANGGLESITMDYKFYHGHEWLVVHRRKQDDSMFGEGQAQNNPLIWYYTNGDLYRNFKSKKEAENTVESLRKHWRTRNDQWHVIRRGDVPIELNRHSKDVLKRKPWLGKDCHREFMPSGFDPNIKQGL